MWVIRYFIPGIILVAFGIFLGSNLNQTTSVQFFAWELSEMPLILIVAVAFVVGFLVRYYVLFTKWMNKKQMARMKKKILAAHESEQEKTPKPEKDYSGSMEERAEEEKDRRLSDTDEESGKSSEEK